MKSTSKKKKKTKTKKTKKKTKTKTNTQLLPGNGALSGATAPAAAVGIGNNSFD